MKILQTSILVVSLIGNAVLIAVVLRTAAQDAPAVSESTNNEARASSFARPKPGPSTALKSTSLFATNTWRTGRSETEMRDIVARLRAAGCPPAILRAAVNQMLQERDNANRPDANLPFWKRPQTTADTATAQRAAINENRRLRVALLGEDGLPSTTFDPVDRYRRYGNLSDEKFDALIKLEREHSDLEFIASRSNSNGDEFRQRQQILEKEKRADLIALLTPAELDQYEMRTTRAANEVQQKTQTIDINEEEYAALYQIQKAFNNLDPAQKENFKFDREDLVKSHHLRQQLNEQARAVLGDDRFYSYLSSSDAQFLAISQFAKQYANLEATSYQLYQLNAEAQIAVQSAPRPTGSDAVEIQRQWIQQVKAIKETYAVRLNALLPPDIAEAFKKHDAGRAFSTR